jgi:Tol biopolymer transport system component
METIGKEFAQPASFALSPDGTRVAYTSAGGPDTPPATWIVDLARSISTRVVQQNSPALKWSPDGKYLYWLGPDNIIRKLADGAGNEELVYKHSSPMLGLGISPDGRHLLFPAFNALFVIGLSRQSQAEKLEEIRSGALTAPRFSPDGRWVAYGDFETGRREIAIRGFPDKRGKWVISNEGGNLPAWRADGNEIFWLSGVTLMAADIYATATTLRAGQPRSLFTLTAPGFQPSADGKRFLVFEPSAAARTEAPMVLVQNWAAGLGK